MTPTPPCNNGPEPRRETQPLNPRGVRGATAYFLWLFLVHCLLLTSGAADPPAKTRVAFFYSTSIFKETILRDETERAFSTAANVDLKILPYTDANDFAEQCRGLLTGREQPDVVLGPSDSASLAALDKSLTQTITVPFVAPFVTTSPSDYERLALVPASPNDERRVAAAVEQFAKYVASRSLACVHTADVWGQGIANGFRSATKRLGTVIHPLPITEMVIGDNGVRTRKDNSDTYTAFLSQMQRQGVAVIAVALINSKSVNDFLDALRKANRDSWIQYKPTILLLNPPTFTQKEGRGISAEFVQEFQIVFARDHALTNGVPFEQRDILPHLDACKIIAAAAAMKKPAEKVVAFYEGGWDDSELGPLTAEIKTGFHRARFSQADEVEVMEAISTGGNIKSQNVKRYFGAGYWRQLAWRSWFFLMHHRTLWHPVLAPAFLLVCFFSLLHWVRSSAMKRPWLIIRTRAFWLLFLINCWLTYSTWVISVGFGLITDKDWYAPLILASLCPTAASAFGDLMKRFLPMINVNGAVQILKELNAEFMREIGNEKLKEYEDWVVAQPCDLLELKRRVYEALVEVSSDPFRNRIREDLNKEIKDAKKDEDQDETQKLFSTRRIYAKYLVQLIAYTSSSPQEMDLNLYSLFPQAELQPRARALYSGGPTRI